VKRVMLESPYAGDFVRNEIYALRAMRHSLDLNEAPFLSHVLYTLVLNDRLHQERRYGMRAGHAWLRASELVVVYQDYGISNGMKERISLALDLNIPVEYREIGKNQ